MLPRKKLFAFVLIIMMAAALAAALSCRQDANAAKAANAKRPPVSSRTSREKLKDTLEGVKIGRAMYHEGLTVFPLELDQPGGPRYKLLEDALDDGDAVVKEKSEGGSVPTLTLKNRSDYKILIINGEEFVGAKQNRIANISMLVKEHSTVEVPVSCVEHGRWSYKSESFSSGAVANAKTRAESAADVQKNIKSNNSFESDQGKVWNNVDELNSGLGVAAPTSAMHDSYDANKDKLDEYTDEFDMPSNAVGYLAFDGHELLAGDIFDSAGTFRRKWDKLLESAAIEILRRDNDSESASRSFAERFMKEVGDSIDDSYSPPGLGVGWHILGDEVVGNILTYEGRILHVSMFGK